MLCILRIKLQSSLRPERTVSCPKCAMNECTAMADLHRLKFSVTAGMKFKRFVCATLSKVNYRVKCSVGAVVESEELRFDINLRDSL